MDTKNTSSVGWFTFSPEQVWVFRIVNTVIICQAVVLLGLVSNIINVIVFSKLGVKDSINISLLALAVSDFLACLTLQWRNICLNPWFQKLDLPFDPSTISVVYSGGLHIVFTRITGIITGFITFERCLCVMAPLKVKQIITRKRVSVFMISTYCICIFGFAPVFYINRYEPVFYESLNKTIIGLVFSRYRGEIERFHKPIYHIFLPCLIFAFVIICTVLLITSLNRKARWREGATGGAKTSEGSTKEKKAATMVALIAVLFIVCFLPNVIIITAMQFDPEFSVAGRKRDLWDLGFSYSFICETINASMNILIYYYKNTNYRNVFRLVILRQRTE